VCHEISLIEQIDEQVKASEKPYLVMRYMPNLVEPPARPV
jgi:hypothetical protein